MECEIRECLRQHYAKGLCQIHYDKKRRYGNPLIGTQYESREGMCDVYDCMRPIRARRLCAPHVGIYYEYGIDPSESFVCYICGSYWDTWPLNRSIDVDHVMPGDDSDLRPTCRECNQRKRSQSYEELLDWCRSVLEYAK